MVQSYNNIFILYIYKQINRRFPMLIRNFDIYLRYFRSEKTKFFCIFTHLFVTLHAFCVKIKQ